MKDYKIGDELLVKGSVYGIDDSGTYQYLVDFDKPFGNSTSHYWVKNDYIIDEPAKPEPTTVSISADVATEMVMNRDSGWNFYGYLDAVQEDATTWPATYAFAFEDPDNMFILAKAWFEGYTIKDKLYNIILGKNTIEVTDVSTDTEIAGLCHDKDGIHLDDNVFNTDLTNLGYRFTQKQIDEYNEDFWIKGIDLNNYKVEVKD